MVLTRLIYAPLPPYPRIVSPVHRISRPRTAHDYLKYALILPRNQTRAYYWTNYKRSCQ